MRSFESITRLILTNSELNTHGNRAEDLDWDRGWLEAQLCSGQIKARQVPQTPQRLPLTSWRCWRGVFYWRRFGRVISIFDCYVRAPAGTLARSH